MQATPWYSAGILFPSDRLQLACSLLQCQQYAFAASEPCFDADDIPPASDNLTDIYSRPQVLLRTNGKGKEIGARWATPEGPFRPPHRVQVGIPERVFLRSPSRCPLDLQVITCRFRRFFVSHSFKLLIILFPGAFQERKCNQRRPITLSSCPGYRWLPRVVQLSGSLHRGRVLHVLLHCSRASL